MSVRLILPASVSQTDRMPIDSVPDVFMKMAFGQSFNKHTKKENSNHNIK